MRFTSGGVWKGAAVGLVLLGAACSKIGDTERNDTVPPVVSCGEEGQPPCPALSCDATNIDAVALSADAAVLLDCNATIDTSLPPGQMLVEWCGPEPTPVVQAQDGGSDVVVFPMASLEIQALTTLRLIGNKPVVLAVAGNALVSGTIDAGAQGTTPGAGGDSPTDGMIATANTVAGSDCDIDPQGTGQGREDGNRALGGGGAGFRTNGAFGGGERPNFRCYKQAAGPECFPYCPDQSCDNSFNDGASRYFSNNNMHYAADPIFGIATQDTSLSPLRAGCAGGKGDGTSAAYYGGAGGGAVQLTVGGTLTIDGNGAVNAGGGGGQNSDSNAGGSGGGSGGAIFIEATAFSLAQNAGIRAHGGAGAGRSCGATTAEDGHADDNLHAQSVGCSSGGRGGLSYWNVSMAACNGSDNIGDAATCLAPVAAYPLQMDAYPGAGGTTDNNGGGGGGGSGGLIVVRHMTDARGCFGNASGDE